MSAQLQRKGDLGRPSFASLLRADIRRSLRWPYVLGAVALALFPLVNLAMTISSFVLRGSLDVYGVAMTSPALLIFPLLCVFLTALPTYQEVGYRYLSMLQQRTRMEDYFASRLIVTSLVAFAVFFLFAFLPFIVSFWVWPVLGNPSIDLANYNMSPAQLLTATYSDTTFSQLLRVNTVAFGIGYSVWVALNAALFSSVGVLCLLVARNRVLALAVPLLLYFGQSLFATLFGLDHSAFMYAVFPFGLTQASIWSAVTPSLALALVMGSGWWWVLRNARFVPGAV